MQERTNAQILCTNIMLGYVGQHMWISQMSLSITTNNAGAQIVALVSIIGEESFISTKSSLWGMNLLTHGSSV